MNVNNSSGRSDERRSFIRGFVRTFYLNYQTSLTTGTARSFPVQFTHFTLSDKIQPSPFSADFRAMCCNELTLLYEKGP